MDFSTIAGLILTLASVIWMEYWYRSHKTEFDDSLNKDPYEETTLPQEMQSWGVMGTFIGITFGLLSLAVSVYTGSKLDNGVNSMLTGMGTAFVTSLWGMGRAFLLKRKQVEQQKLQDDVTQIASGETITDLIKYLQKTEDKRNLENQSLLELMKSSNQILAETISTAMQDMKKSLVGDGDYTVIGQMRLIRSENRDEIERLRMQVQQDNLSLIQEFRDFAKNMAENNAKSFIEALTETMKDFNTKLTEQFGENFKELNVAVGRLLEWQRQYMDTLEEVARVQKEIFAGIDGVRHSMENIEVSAKGITDTANELSDVVLTAKSYNEQMKQLMLDLSAVGEQAYKTIPEIENCVNTACSKISDIVTMSTAEMKLNSDTAVSRIEDMVGIAIEKNTQVHAKTEEYATELMAEIKENGDLARNTAINHIDETAASAIEKSAWVHDRNEKYATSILKAIQENGDEARDTAIRQVQTVFGNAMMTQENCEKNMTEVYVKALERLQAVTKELQANGKTMSDNSAEALKGISDQANRLIQAMEDVSHALSDSATSVQRDMEASAKSTHEAVRKAADSLREDSYKVTKSVSDAMETMMKDNNESLQKASSNLSKELENALNESLESFGRMMVAVSNRFAQDYGPLADRLREVVQLANKIEKQR